MKTSDNPDCKKYKNHYNEQFNFIYFFHFLKYNAPAEGWERLIQNKDNPHQLDNPTMGLIILQILMADRYGCDSPLDVGYF